MPDLSLLRSGLSRRAVRACVLASIVTPLAAAGVATGCSSASKTVAPSPTSGTASAPAPIVPAGYAPLKGSLHPYARAERDIGRVAPETAVGGASLLLQMSPAQASRAKGVLANLQDPSSASYHQWLTPAQLGASFGASDADVARATAWLQKQGLTVHGPSATRSRILFSGTVGQVESTFQTEIHRYQVDGKEHFAPATAPLVPTELASLVMGVHGLHDFQLTPAAPHRRPGDIYPVQFEDAGTEGWLTLGPRDFASIYDVAPLYAEGLTGRGQKIAIIGVSDFNDEDIVQFRTAYGLDTTNLPKRVLVPLSGSSEFDTETQLETNLDLEWSGGVAKDASITFIHVGDNPAYGVFDGLLYAIEHATAPIVSSSYIGCELGESASDMIFAESMGDAASMMGMTVLNASGDWGATGCDMGLEVYESDGGIGTQTSSYYGLSVNWPTSIPSFVSVGGTELSWGAPFPQPLITTTTMTQDPLAEYWACTGSDGSVTGCAAKGYVPESGWNELAFELPYGDFWGAGGGGQSEIFPRPIWQQGTTLPGQNRMVPDVSLTAAAVQVGYQIYLSWTAADGNASPPVPGSMFPVGGTSAATPSFAGILALVNQSLQQAHPGAPVGLGNANPILYALDAATKGTASPVFHDITTGNNEMPCTPGTTDCPIDDAGTSPATIGYVAGPGYDMVTGIGSVRAARLVHAWTELAPTATSLRIKLPAAGAVEGALVRLSASVASREASEACDLNGSVLFYLETLDSTGKADLSEMATAPLASGTATTQVTVPPGILGTARVVAFYSGDAHHLASWSAETNVKATSTFTASPTAITVPPFAAATLTTSGGVLPLQWRIVRDGSCGTDYACSQVYPTTGTNAVLYSGGNDGQVTVSAIDADGAEVLVIATVSEGNAGAD